jgi:DNA-nicking Smr family endonuclease
MTDKLNEDDKQLFRQAMRGVKPLANSDKIALTHGQTSDTAYRRKQAQHSPEQLKTKLTIRDTITTDAIMAYRQSGVAAKQWQQLKQGQLKIEATLDLHGLTVEKALLALENFFNQAYEQEWRVLRIIHGKGHTSTASSAPALKNAVYAFLQSTPRLIAFHSAPATAGGNGAVLVLLKNYR